MEANVSTTEDFGEDFLEKVRANGSLSIARPLLSFLDKSGCAEPLRSSVKICRPALKADIAHFLNICFGRHPGIVDHAANKIVDHAARNWLLQAIDGFSVERQFLNRLTVAAGPIHRQLGQDRITALLEGQSRSIEMLATSERVGCPAGAAIAFVIDWKMTRPLLDHVALALSIEVPPCLLPDDRQTMRLVRELAGTASIRRAINFGGDQMLALQKGLWQLVATRHQAMLTEQ
jgi:hypothetical protein